MKVTLLPTLPLLCLACCCALLLLLFLKSPKALGSACAVCHNSWPCLVALLGGCFDSAVQLFFSLKLRYVALGLGCLVPNGMAYSHPRPNLAMCCIHVTVHVLCKLALLG